MNNTLQILTGFLDKYGDDVQGHADEAPPADLQARFREFARGTLAEAERARLSQLLKDNPQWIPALASEARAGQP